MTTARTLPLVCACALAVPAVALAQDSLAPASSPQPEVAFTAAIAGHTTVRAQMAAAHRRAQTYTLARTLRRLEIRLARIRGVRAPRRSSLRRGLMTLPRHALRGRIRRLRRTVARERVYASVAVPGVLQAIANCESHGNPRAIGGGGKFRGKYQFDYGTWASVGGRGDPAAAPEREQDMRAAVLYRRAGSSPWPVCGR